MKYSSPLLFLVLLISVQPGQAQSVGRLTGTVERVVDGDTFYLRNAGGVDKIRLYAADAPEKSQEHGTQATQAFQTHGASFVTLTKNGQQGKELRGCIGSLQAHRPLFDDVQAKALAAALHDPRFPPVTAQELPHLQVEVSVLSAPEPLQHANESHALWQLRPGIDGLIFEATVNGQSHRSTYLPQVWEQIPEPRAFLAHLKVKAGLPFDFWSTQVKLSRYEVQKFHEH